MTTPVNDALEKSFLTHAHYLRAFAQLAGFTYWPNKDLAVLQTLAQRVATAFPVPKAIPSVDIDEMAKCLNRAWGTELLLGLASNFEEDELIRLSNSWGSVQTYYVGYAATQALIVAEGRSRPTDHPKTQSQVRTLWVDRQSAVEPFSFAAMPGCKSNPLAYANGPGRPIDAGVTGWPTVGTTNCWDIAATALRSTRNDAVEKKLHEARVKKAREKKKAWHTEEADRLTQGKKARKEPGFSSTSNLTASERAAVEAGVRPYTMLDYLFRLRIKANYEEAAMFTDGPTTEFASSGVALDMVRIASAIMVAHEVRIARLVGKATVTTLASDWITKNSAPSNLGIARRMPILTTTV
ncbi:hypothetical protein [Mycobacteroides abscessus]|uniref:Uncharacterized protein n=1 Tax=Mycobacteroides abscessus subsp. massiliense TaxID=1962118 RepID=A0A1T7GH10_9MYCO|nr:hypothetical protein [Mycobacteroides abscessus]AMU64873.1 hypothetical protein A3O04_05925 [Mycobacteroides abscessus]ARQ63672.1 hypothetical protein CAK77_05825 [Mycobacteroides abscessus subsp. massiliense]EIV67653.1 hypothetical protein MMCCUG48898_0985 [Mycobacteroides abscessus subsp. massiliense CCUG 48898 = JCM 15300]MBE5405653.1 hypothetical protein [Mycobacteroides abscessus]MBE5429637.1 hypothetical protein [Mycobacteroides abscessus]